MNYVQHFNLDKNARVYRVSLSKSFRVSWRTAEMRSFTAYAGDSPLASKVIANMTNKPQDQLSICRFRSEGETSRLFQSFQGMGSRAAISIILLTIARSICLNFVSDPCVSCSRSTYRLCPEVWLQFGYAIKNPKFAFREIHPSQHPMWGGASTKGHQPVCFCKDFI